MKNKNKNKNGTDDKNKITTSTKYPLCSCENWKFEHTKNQPTTYTITLHPMLHHHHGHYTYFPKSTTQCVHCIYSFNEHVVHNKTCLYVCICVCKESTYFKGHHKCNGVQHSVWDRLGSSRKKYTYIHICIATNAIRWKEQCQMLGGFQQKAAAQC